MEIRRTKLMDAVGMPVHEMFKQGIVPVLVNTNITCKSPLYPGETVHIELWLSELRNASAVMQFQFFNNEKTLVAEGLQKGLFVDHKTMRPRRLTRAERSLFLPFAQSKSDDQTDNQSIDMTPSLPSQAPQN